MRMGGKHTLQRPKTKRAITSRTEAAAGGRPPTPSVRGGGVDKPAGWRESKKRKGEGGQPASKGVPGFKSLSAYKEKYRPLLMASGWGFGGKVMPKNSWTAWKEAVTTLLDMLAKQGLHQLTSGSNVGGSVTSVGVVAGATSGVAAAAAAAADGEEMGEVDGNGEHEVGEEEEEEADKSNRDQQIGSFRPKTGKIPFLRPGHFLEYNMRPAPFANTT